MKGYYSDKLAAERLAKVYELAPPRVRQYLEAEISHVTGRLSPSDHVLELGCGYGRVLSRLAEKAALAVGIDTSLASLRSARQALGALPNCHLAAMDAAKMAFREGAFDVVVCIQNGISAFHVDQLELMHESLRVLRPGGRALFSSYAARFWDHRLEWFRLQSEAGLLGEIDYERTGDGRIACKDGFTATTVSPGDFSRLAANLGVKAAVHEVDRSSLFCEIVKP